MIEFKKKAEIKCPLGSAYGKWIALDTYNYKKVTTFVIVICENFEGGVNDDPDAIKLVPTLMVEIFKDTLTVRVVTLKDFRAETAQELKAASGEEPSRALINEYAYNKMKGPEITSNFYAKQVA